MKPKHQKLTEDQQLARYAVRMQRRLDRALAAGRIDRYTYRDVSFKLLLLARPRDCARVTGLGTMPV